MKIPRGHFSFNEDYDEDPQGPEIQELVSVAKSRFDLVETAFNNDDFNKLITGILWKYIWIGIDLSDR